MSKQILAGNSAFKLISTLISHKILRSFFFLVLFLAGSAIAQPKQEYTSKSKKAINAFEEGTELYNQRRDDDAIKSYKKASEIDPSFVEPLIMIGQIYNDQKKYEEALEYSQKAYSVNPTFFSALAFRDRKS